MASGDRRAAKTNVDGSGLTIAVIAARWNEDIVARLVEGATRGLDALGVTNVHHVSVPGAFELPLAARIVATPGGVDGIGVDGIVVAGAVIRGETTHYELVANECGRGIQDVQHETGVPIGFGVLTVENLAQANARSEPAGGHNVGEEAALVAVEMACLRAAWAS